MMRSTRNMPLARESGTVPGWIHAKTFAATPPLAAMRFILSRAASRALGRCLGLWDVSVAFFHAAIEEEVFVRPPKNMRKDKTIWRLLRAMYGTQVASSRWQRLVRETLCDGHRKVLSHAYRVWHTMRLRTHW